MKSNLLAIISTLLLGYSANAATLDCSIPGEFPQPDHIKEVLVNNMAQVSLGQASQYQVTASAIGQLVVIMAEVGDQRVSSSDSPRANLRIESAGMVSEYFCEVK